MFYDLPFYLKTMNDSSAYKSLLKLKNALVENNKMTNWEAY